MKKKLLFSVILLAIATLLPKQSKAYDFSAVAPSGQTLYYNFQNDGEGVYVVWPNANAQYYNETWDGYTKPTGDLTIPNSVTYDGQEHPVQCIWGAFYNCTELTSVTIPSSVTLIGNRAFYGCSGLTGSLTIPNSVTSIDEYAFSGDTSITSVTIGTSVTSIGGQAFENCHSLTSLTIPASVTSIGDDAFAYCGSLTSVYYTGDVAGWCGIELGNVYSNPLSWAHNLYINDTLVTDLVIPNSVTEIKNFAFIYASCLTSLTIPTSVTSIGTYAFLACTGLTTLTIPSSVTEIGFCAFASCDGLTTVNYNATDCNALTFEQYERPGEFFSNCEALTTLNIGNNVTKIPDNAFSYCSSLTSVTSPTSVTSIGDRAFYYCRSLTTVNFNATNCSTMGSSSNPVFDQCTALATLNIGNNVTIIPSYAFYNLNSLEEIHSHATLAPSLGTDAFFGVSNTIPVYVPCECQNAYHSSWTYFSNIIEDCDPQGIDDIAADKVKIRTLAGEIIVEGTDANSKVVVYDLKGCIVHRGRIDGPIHVNAAGVYMVKIDNLQPEKIVVR